MDADAGMVTEAKLLHPENALSPMVCNAPGKATEAKLLHSQSTGQEQDPDRSIERACARTQEIPG